MRKIKIVPVDANYVWDHLIEGFEINMIEEDNVVYYLNEFTCDQVAKWLYEVINGERAAAFFYLQVVNDAAE